MKNCRKILIAYLVFCMMLLYSVSSMAEGVFMPDLTDDPLSLKITMVYKNEEGIVTQIPGVTLQAIQVADLEVKQGSAEYTLTEDFAETEIVFAGMSTSQSIDYAKVMDELAEKNAYTGIDQATGSDGVVSFSDLNPGIYLIRQIAAQTDEFEKMDPFLMMVPLPIDGTSGKEWLYQVEVFPKPEIKRHLTPEGEGGTINVTKNILVLGDTAGIHLYAKDDYFEVGIFLDPQGQVPAFEDYIKRIDFAGDRSNAVSYENIPEGTYYIFELDHDRKPVQDGAALEHLNTSCVCILENGGQVDVNLDNARVTDVNIGNYFVTFPDGYFVKGTLHLLKEVRNAAGDKILVDDTFYASVFTKEGNDYVLYDTFELEQNEEIEIEVPLGGPNQDEPITYYIYETDEDGNRVNPNTFAYHITGDGQTVIFSNDQLVQKAMIINEEYGPTETPTPTPEETVTPPPTTPDNPGVPPIKTGDNTPILYWILALLASAGIMGVVLRRKVHM